MPRKFTISPLHALFLTILSTSRNALSSPLLRLPAELRQQIYVYVIDNTSTRKGTYHEAIPFHPRSVQHLSSQLWLGLLQTCRQAYHEAAHLPLSLNMVSIQEISELKSFLDHVVAGQRYPPTKLRIRIPVCHRRQHIASAPGNSLVQSLRTVRQLEVHWQRDDGNSRFIMPATQRAREIARQESVWRGYLAGSSGAGVELVFTD
jgi:hypothetical protein